MSSERKVTRRKFIGTASAGAVALSVAPGLPAAPGKAPAFIPRIFPSATVNLGFIGVGVRGKQLMDYAGFPDPAEARRRMAAARNRRGARVSETDNLPRPLDVRALGVSDLYQGNQQYGRLSAGQGVQVYPQYEAMLENPDIHAVVIATSDHNHAPIGIAAARAGKAIYSEKCFAHTIEQAEDYRDAVKRAGVVFQLGHQTRSGSMTRKVREAIGPGGIGPDGALGKVTLIESYTNRNDPNGAWVYRIPTDASPETIDWRRFLGSARRRDFDADRFFRWRKYWDYGTGLAGDLLTHEFDAIQQITGLGIPDTCFSTGGIHYWRDGRETPDTLQATYHYEREELLVTYAATLANGWRREIRLLGHDATLDMTGGARMHVDPDSDRYAARIEKGEWEIPIGDEADIAAREEIRAATEDTRRWTVDKGIYVDVVGGVEVNVTALHILNFVEAVRGEVEATNCGIDTAFEEAVIAHMATISMQRGRRVRWDRRRERVVNDG